MDGLPASREFNIRRWPAADQDIRHIMAANTTRRFCIFCGGRDLTKEHVLPQWISRTFARLGPGTFDLEMVNDSGLRKPLRWTNEKAIELTVKVVCKSCNEGWMAALESQIIPILTPLIKGEPRRLDSPACKVLAAWTFKTTLLAEYAYPEAPHFSIDEAASLYRDHKVPSMAVQIGAYQGSEYSLRHKMGRVGLLGDRGVQYRGCTSTFVIGHSLLHLWSARFPKMTESAEVAYPPEFIERLILVWPAPEAAVQWPPPTLFADSDLANLERWPPVLDENQ